MKTRKNRHLILTIPILVVILIMAYGCTKKEAQQQEAAQEIHWIENIDQGLALGKEQDKPLLIDFTATWCPPCKKMEDSTFSNPGVIKKTDSFVTVRIDVDKQAEIANNYKSNAGKYGGIGIPNILFLNKEGNELKHPIGYLGPEKFIAIMDSVLSMTK